MSVQQQKFKEIADAIRTKTGEADLIKPSDFADKVNDVFNAGKLDERDTFWKGFQQSGARVDYGSVFRGAHDIDKWFYPVRDFKPTNCTQMFREASCSEPFSLAERLDECGVMFDTSNCTALNMTFYYFRTLTELPVISFEGLTDTYYTSSCFAFCSNLKTIRGIIPTPAANTTRTQFWDMFDGCTALENLTIMGTIELNWNFAPCTALTHISLMSIINNLADYSGSGTSHTLTLGTRNLAKLTDAEKAIATEKGWTIA